MKLKLKSRIWKQIWISGAVVILLCGATALILYGVGALNGPEKGHYPVGPDKDKQSLLTVIVRDEQIKVKGVAVQEKYKFRFNFYQKDKNGNLVYKDDANLMLDYPNLFKTVIHKPGLMGHKITGVWWNSNTKQPTAPTGWLMAHMNKANEGWWWNLWYANKNSHGKFREAGYSIDHLPIFKGLDNKVLLKYVKN